MATLHDAVWYQIMQSALSKAYPSGLPSNQVLNQFAMPSDNISVAEVVQTVVTQMGYSYGSGQWVSVSSSGTYSVTSQLASCWLLRLDAQNPPGSSVSLSAAVGSGSMQPVEQIDPAQSLVYADDLFPWSTAVPLGTVGMPPWGIPSGWTDSNAQWMGPVSGSASSAPVGQWLLKKWIFVGTSGNYTFTLAASDSANLFMDGQTVITGASTQSATSQVFSLSAGWHLCTVSCINAGSTPNPTGVLLSITDSNGNVLENGSFYQSLGTLWQTSGYSNPVWTTVNTANDLLRSWWVIPASLITSGSAQLQVSTTPNSSGQSPQVYGVWWYAVAPWRWDESGQYDRPAVSSTPAQIAPAQSTEVFG